MKVRELIRLLEKNEWRKDRQKGSHQQFRKAGHPLVLSVAGKPTDDVGKGFENDILKKAGLR